MISIFLKIAITKISLGVYFNRIRKTLVINDHEFNKKQETNDGKVHSKCSR